MAKSNTTAGEGILNQTIALVEKLRAERDDALVEAREMQLRLTRIVEGEKSTRKERDVLKDRLEEALMKDRLKTNEINLLTKEVRDIMDERNAAYELLHKLSEALPPDMAETWAHDLFGQARWNVEKYAVLLREWQATHPPVPDRDGKRPMISEMKVKTL